jgi:hypothetical protein
MNSLLAMVIRALEEVLQHLNLFSKATTGWFGTARIAEVVLSILSRVSLFGMSNRL